MKKLLLPKPLSPTIKQLFFYLILLLLLLMTCSPVIAQDKWQVASCPAANFPTEELCEVKLERSYGFDVSVGVRVMSPLYINGGCGWNHFSPKNSLLLEVLDFEENSYLLGGLIVVLKF